MHKVSEAALLCTVSYCHVYYKTLKRRTMHITLLGNAHA